MSARLWPVAESAQADYEQLREIVLAGGELGEVLAARRFDRRGLAGLISWPSAEPTYLGSLIGADRTAWCGRDDPASSGCTTPSRSCSAFPLRARCCGRWASESRSLRTGVDRAPAGARHGRLAARGVMRGRRGPEA